LARARLRSTTHAHTRARWRDDGSRATIDDDNDDNVGADVVVVGGARGEHTARAYRFKVL